MPKEVTLLNRGQRLLVRLLEELERPHTSSRTKAIARLESRLERDFEELESHLPLKSDKAYLNHNGHAYGVLRVSVHGAAFPDAIRRRAIVRSLQLLDESATTLPSRIENPILSFAAGVTSEIRTFAYRHPFLVTVIILMLIVVLIWRQNFTFSTKFGNAEITIQGERSVPAISTDEFIGPLNLPAGFTVDANISTY